MIVETKTKFRSNVEQAFFVDVTPGSARSAMQTAVKPLKDAGLYTVEHTYPDTTANLAMREVNTFANLAVFGWVDSAKGVAFDQEFLTYYAAEDLAHPPEANIGNVGYQLTGINDVFHVSTVYNFPVDNDPYIPVMEQSLSIAYDHKGKLVDTIITTNSITVVHQYNNSEDFVGTHYKDLLAYVPSLSTKNATRTITYTNGAYTKP